MLKKIIIKMIVYYQNKAPRHIRESCLYTPTCSQYMIMSVEKYGAFIGIALGINRIISCRAPNGGIDYP